MHRIVAIPMVVVVLIGGIARSQSGQPVPAGPDAAALFVGQPIADARNALKLRSIEHGENGFAFAQGDPDQSHLAAVIDNKRVYLCICFSKSKSQVTGLDMVFSPAGRTGKAYESWVSAKKIVLNEDGSYSVLFARPATQE